MAQFSITIPDALVPRIRKAFGHWDSAQGAWVDATAQEVLVNIKAFIKGQVSSYEATVASKNAADSVTNENW